MTMEGFRVPDEKSLREYIKATPSLASKLGNEVDNLKIKEVGDGNLNFVYIVISPSGSTVVKQKESKLFKKYGRPTILHFARGLGDCYKQLNGGQGPEIYLKREVENPTGSFKMNNVVAQILLAKKLGKTCIDAEFGSGATWYSSCGFMCTILAKMSYVTPLCDGELGVLHGSMTACCRQSKSLIPAWILEGLITRGWDRRSAIYKRSGG